MAHVNLPAEAPGIVGLLRAFPHTGRTLGALAEALLRAPSSLTPAERELIAASVSDGNECWFCTQSHAAAARRLFGADAGVVDAVLNDLLTAPITDKMRALLVIAEKVRRDGRLVGDADVAWARAAGADDRAIHDTVLIAAAFCMFNRYVDGLATTAPRDPKAYAIMGERLAANGYLDAGG